MFGIETAAVMFWIMCAIGYWAVNEKNREIRVLTDKWDEHFCEEHCGCNNEDDW